MKRTRHQPPEVAAIQIRDRLRRDLNGAIAVLCPGRSNSIREAIAIARKAVDEAESALPALESAERRETRMKRSTVGA